MSTASGGPGRFNKLDIWDKRRYLLAVRERRGKWRAKRVPKKWGYMLLIDLHREGGKEIWIQKEQRSQELYSKWTGTQKWESARPLHYHNPRAQERRDLSFYFFSFTSLLWQPSLRIAGIQVFQETVLTTWRPIPNWCFSLGVSNSSHFVLTGLDFLTLMIRCCS